MTWSSLLAAYGADRNVVSEIARRERSYLESILPTDTIRDAVRLPNDELVAAALRVVAELRAALERHRSESTRLIFDQSSSNGRTDEERQTALRARNAAISSASDRVLAAYMQLKVRVLMLRDELVRRLAPGPSDPSTDFKYEHPTNPLGVEAVATDLEKLALSLPSA